uniref:Uncharacterized protein n=1 Tax=Periophthalmus magnuspinnatus TaxID=409849 RepID=A0A3B4AXE3_9GOBI
MSAQPRDRPTHSALCLASSISLCRCLSSIVSDAQVRWRLGEGQRMLRRGSEDAQRWSDGAEDDRMMQRVDAALSLQQLDEMRRDLRWLTDALQFARYKQPKGGVSLLTLMPSHTETHQTQKSDSTSSNMDYLPTPSPSPEPRRRQAGTDSQLCSDEDCSSEVFLPTDSDYDSSDPLSPRDSLYLSPSSVRDPKPDALPLFPPSKDLSVPPLSPLPSPLSPSVSDTSKTLELLSLSDPVKPLTAPAKRKLLSRSHRGQYFSGPQRWIRAQSGESHTGALSEGVYTKQSDSSETRPGMRQNPDQT